MAPTSTAPRHPGTEVPTPPPSGTVATLPPTSAELARLSDAELMEEAAATSRALASLAGRFVLLGAELDRREGWRAEGATSLEAWMVERCGVSRPSARAYAQVGQALFDLPQLASALCAGSLSFDKVRTVAPMTTPERDAEVAALSKEASVHDLAAWVRTRRGDSGPDAEAEESRRALRFNDTARTLSAQLPEASYVAVRTRLETLAKAASSFGVDGRSWDQRLADALVEVVTSGTGPGASGGASGGLISGEVFQRLACDATVVVALDDDVGHTMYEGRARREPTETQRRELWRRDRHCRFPGCAHTTFTNAHHLDPWTPSGLTDLDNLVLLCEHHHHRVHAKEWRVTGNANEELCFVGPSGRVMTSRPSLLWTTVSGPKPA
jgi:Domain of unknown function (DUF222)